MENKGKYGKIKKKERKRGGGEKEVECGIFMQWN